LLLRLFNILIPIITILLSCSNNTISNTGKFEDTSLSLSELRTRGNVLPIDILEIRLNTIIPISDYKVDSIIFIDESKLACSLANGKVYIVDTINSEIHEIYFEQNQRWTLFPYNNTVFIATNRGHINNEGERIRDWIFISTKGLNPKKIFNVRDLSPPVVINDNYVYSHVNDNVENLLTISPEGIKDACIISNNSYFPKLIYSLENTIVASGNSQGPTLIKNIDGSYSTPELWNSTWNAGGKYLIFTPNHKYIYMQYGEQYPKLIIIPQGDDEVKTVDFIADLSLKGIMEDKNKFEYQNLASNGDKVLILYKNVVMQYFKEEVEIMADNLDMYDNEYEAISFISDNSCKSFVIVSANGFIIWHDGLQFQPYGAKKTSNLIFTTDARRCALGLIDSSIVIYDIISGKS
jgi:hypothetical protein